MTEFDQTFNLHVVIDMFVYKPENSRGDWQMRGPMSTTTDLIRIYLRKYQRWVIALVLYTTPIKGTIY